MPFIPLITASIESVLNTFLYRDAALRAARQRVQGKVLRVVLPELTVPLVLVFSERQLDVLTQWEAQADCTVTTRLSVLPKLRDRQQLTALIRQGELEVDGDIQVVQHVLALFDLAEFDLAELLAPWLGDVAAEGIGRVARGGTRLLVNHFSRKQRYLADALTEEWRLAPGPLEAAWFNDEVGVVERQTTLLGQRLDRLEGK